VTGRSRVLGAVLIVLVLLAGAGYAGWRIMAATPAGGGPLDLTRAGTLLYVGPDGRVHQLDGDHEIGTGPSCLRAHAAGGTLVCLRANGLPGGYEVVAFSNERERVRLPVWGTPSRARVSPSGRLIAWTVFRTGDSYLPTGRFSTTAGIYDLATGAHYGSLEDFTSIVDNRELAAADRNFWGITFASDDRTFYATLSSGGRIWLMRGDLSTRRLEAIRENVECPSLSPDGTRIAYKLRSGQQWRLQVLNLDTGADTAVAESSNVDDQAAWLDEHTLGYSRDGTLYSAPVHGPGQPEALRAGTSPAALFPM
jgi:hypothetical protein